MELEEMREVERFVSKNLDSLDSMQMIEAIRDKFFNLALIGYGVCYYASRDQRNSKSFHR